MAAATTHDGSGGRMAARWRRPRTLIASGATAVAFALALAAPAAGQADGFSDLAARLGPGSMPTGAGIGVGLVEALSGGNYAPASANFPNQAITLMSGASGGSGHANSVLSGLINRAPGVPAVWSWEALDWLQSGFLRFQSGPPLTPPGNIRLFNHSWIAGVNDPPVDNEVMRRFDFQINRDNTFHTPGTGNSLNGATPFILSSQFNAITVGHPNGARSDTPGGGRDGTGRMKPDLVVQSVGTSSSAAPRAGAAAVLLIDTALNDPTLSGDPGARRTETIKAALLVGADRTEAWNNQPTAKGPDRGRTTRPLDVGWGAGFLNVDRSHLVLTGGRQSGAAAVPLMPTIEATGWDLLTIPASTSRFWRFRLNEPVEEIAIVATWNRFVASTFASWNMMDIDLLLHRVEGSELLPLIGDAGLDAFGSGNVTSESAVDNVELLVVRDLAAGNYVIEARRAAGATDREVAIAWIMPETEKPLRPADLNGDGVVNGADLGILLANWGNAGVGDITGDGLVDGADLGLLLADWG